MNKRTVIIIVLILLIALPIIIYATTYPFNNVNPMIRNEAHKYKEADYVNAYCKGIVEYKLLDKTRVDCLTDEYAIEFDWAKKWAESVGQSLYYAKKTGKKPAVAIIMKSPTDERYIKRIEEVDKNITIFRIKAYE